MELHYGPLPHVHLLGEPLKMVLANSVMYGISLGLIGTCLWLGVMFWQER